MPTTYLINDADKVVIPENSNIKRVDNFVISEIKEKGMFGGSFIKIGIKGVTSKVFVSSTLSEDNLKQFISDHYNIKINNLFKYF